MPVDTAESNSNEEPMQLDDVDPLLSELVDDANPFVTPSSDWTPSTTPSTGMSAPNSSPSPPGLGSKRSYDASSQSTCSSTESDDSDSNEARAHAAKTRRLNQSGAKAKSWVYQKKLKMTSADRDFTPSDTRLGNFRSKVLRDDSHAEFDSRNLSRVRCSACASWLVMRTLYDILRWKEHRESPRCQAKQQQRMISRSIRTFFTPRVTAAIAALTSPTYEAPCPGLARSKHKKICSYLRRTLAAGGGAPSRTKITQSLFGTNAVYGHLSESQKKMVLRREDFQFQWRNNRTLGAVFSSVCEGVVAVLRTDGEPHPCDNCQSLHHLHKFQVAIGRPIPSEENMKFVPADRRDPDISAIYLKIKGVRDLVETVRFFLST